MKLITLTILVLTFCLQAQGNTTLNNGKSSLKILGTSTLHDWESIVNEYKTTVQFVGDTIQEFSLSAKVTSIKSGKESMDENTWEALKADDYPTIDFNSLKIVTTKKDSTHELQATGNLNIAGAAKEVTIKGQLIRKNGGYLLTGIKDLKMTDFNIEPPTMFLGTIKTGDKISIQFSLFYTIKE